MSDRTEQPTRIGRYDILGKLGQGAMGTVYRAEDPLIKRQVAIKVLHVRQDLSPRESGADQDRFMREAQVAGKLDHPNVVRVYDFGQAEPSGEPFIVMEYLAGPSLETVMSEHRMQPEQVLRLLEQLVAGIDAAHSTGIVHRDIKPANILFTEDGEQAKIADFGIARGVNTHATQDLKKLGTPIYMAPEQAMGQRLDGRADLFALGVMSYKLFTGRSPYEGDDVVSLAYQVVHSTPKPVSQLAKDLPLAVDAVMSRILAKNPADRYATGREFYQALSAAFHPVPQKPARPEHAAVAAPVASPKTSAQPVKPQPKANAPAASARRSAWRGPLPWAVGCVGVLCLAWLCLPTGSGKAKGGSVAKASPAATVDASPAAGVRSESVAEIPPVPAVTRTDPPKPVVKPKPPRPAPRAAAPALPQQPAEPPKHAPVVEAPLVAAVEQRPVQPPVSKPPGRLEVKLRHRINNGSFTLLVDGRPALTGNFSKRKLDPSKISTWDPITVQEGAHHIVARVIGGKGKEYDSAPITVRVGADSTVALRVTIEDDRLELVAE